MYLFLVPFVTKYYKLGSFHKIWLFSLSWTRNLLSCSENLRLIDSPVGKHRYAPLNLTLSSYIHISLIKNKAYSNPLCHHLNYIANVLFVKPPSWGSWNETTCFCYCLLLFHCLIALDSYIMKFSLYSTSMPFPQPHHSPV